MAAKKKTAAAVPVASQPSKRGAQTEKDRRLILGKALEIAVQPALARGFRHGIAG